MTLKRSVQGIRVWFEHINNYNDIQTGEFIESFEEVAVKQTL